MGVHRKKKAHFQSDECYQGSSTEAGHEQWGRGGLRGVARRVIWKLVRSGEPWELLRNGQEVFFMNSEETIGPVKAQGMWGERWRQAWRS